MRYVLPEDYVDLLQFILTESCIPDRFDILKYLFRPHIISGFHADDELIPVPSQSMFSYLFSDCIPVRLQLLLQEYIFLFS